MSKRHASRQGLRQRAFPQLRVQDIAAVGFLLAATFLFFWPVWSAGYRFPKGGGDLWGQLYPVWSYISDWIRRGVFPLWSTRIMLGDPIISEPQFGLLNPLNWALFLTHPIPSWLVLLRGACPLWLAGTGLYLYLRYSLGHQPASALIGAAIYMFSDPFISHLGHPQFNDVIAWVPWLLLTMDQATTQARWIPPAALFTALLVAGGHGQATLYAACLTVGYGLALPWLRHRQHTLGHQYLYLGLVALLGAAIAAPVLLPAIERLPHTVRSILPPDTGEYEWHWGMWRDLITPLYHGRNVKTFWGPWDRVETGYVGIVALSLAALGLARGRRRAMAFWGATAVLAILFALGTQGPIYSLLKHLPLFESTWKTGRAIWVFSLSAAIAAAEGAQVVFSGRAPRLWLVAGFAAAIWIAGQARAWSLVAPTGEMQRQALMGLWFAGGALALAMTAAWFAPSYRIGGAIILLLCLAESFFTSAMADLEKAPATLETPHSEALSYLQHDSGWFRVDVDGEARGLWSPAALMTAGFDVPQGIGDPLEIAVAGQFYWGIPHKGMPAYHLLGAKYIIVPKGAQPGGKGIWPVFTEDSLVDIHLNTRALPRVWLVYQTVSVTSMEEALAHVYAPDFQPEVVAILINGPSLNHTGSGTLEVVAYGPNRASFRVNTTAPALLVLSDLRYPGWVGHVDGRHTPIWAADGIFRGIIVPAGHHIVEFTYRPAAFIAGIGIMVVALGVALSLGLRAFRSPLKGQGGEPG
ncbi:MAG TPA: hypothetical protein ENL34_01535 [Chloroflexi bacterium]|nr:hypothetical protein [Chloroflexota bacterium]